MRSIVVLGLALLLAAHPVPDPGPSGELIASEPCPPLAQPYEAYVAAAEKAYAEESALGAQAGVPQPPIEKLHATMVTRAEYDAAVRADTQCRKVFYRSDGLKVAAIVWNPVVQPGKRLPVVLSLRGGNHDFGKFTPASGRRMHALTSAGFLVIGVQYRGTDGGEGADQFGGDDVHDVLAAIALARSLPEADPDNLFLIGTSRGGMMAYLALKQGARVNAAAVVSGLADLELEAKRRPEVEAMVWRRLIPDYDAHRAELLRARSGVEIARTTNLPPLLLLHGTQDWRADPANSIEVADALKQRGRPYSLHLQQGDVHGLLLGWRERDGLIRDWFCGHMAKGRRCMPRP